MINKQNDDGISSNTIELYEKILSEKKKELEDLNTTLDRLERDLDENKRKIADNVFELKDWDIKRDSMAKKLYKKRYIEQAIAKVGIPVDLTARVKRTMEKNNVYKRESEIRKTDRSKITDMRNEIGKLSQEIMALEHKKESLEKSIAWTDKVIKALISTLWPIQSLEKISDISEKTNILIAKLEQILKSVKNLDKQKDAEQVKEAFQKECIKTLYEIIKSSDGLEYLMTKRADIMYLPEMSTNLGNIGLNNDIKLNQQLKTNVNNLFKDVDTNKKHIDAIVYQNVFNAIMGGINDLQKDWTSRIIDQVSKFVNDYDYIKNNYKKDWEILAEYVSRLFIKGVSMGNINAEYLDRFKKILPSHAYRVFRNKLLEAPIEYKGIDDMIKQMNTNENIVRDWDFRSEIKGKEFQFYAMIANIKKDQDVIRKIDRIIGAAISKRHRDGTNSNFFIQAIEDIRTNKLYKSVMPD